METVLTRSRILFGDPDTSLADFPLKVQGSCLVLYGRPDTDAASLFMNMQQTVQLFQPTEKHVVAHNVIKFRIPVTAISHLAYHAATDLKDPDTNAAASGIRIQVVTAKTNYVLDVIMRDVDMSLKLKELEKDLETAMSTFSRLTHVI